MLAGNALNCYYSNTLLFYLLYKMLLQEKELSWELTVNLRSILTNLKAAGKCLFEVRIKKA